MNENLLENYSAFARENYLAITFNLLLPCEVSSRTEKNIHYIELTHSSDSQTLPQLDPYEFTFPFTDGCCEVLFVQIYDQSETRRPRIKVNQ